MDFHPLAEAFPLMPEHDLGRMEQDMRQSGFDPAFPIVTFKKKILDGRNRFIAATRAEVKPIFEAFLGNDKEAEEFVRRANEERRHLEPEWLKKRREERIGRVIEARRDGESLRTIAESEQISVVQVQRDLSTVPGGTVAPVSGQITGNNGKVYDAPPEKPLCKRCARNKRIGKKPVKNCEACQAIKLEDLPETEEAAKLSKPNKKKPKKVKAVLKDALGTVIPDHLRDVWSDPALPCLIDELGSLESVLGEPWLKRIEKIASFYPFLLIADFQKHVHDAQEGLQLALESLRAGVPYALCPKCSGAPGEKPCRVCRTSGLIPQHRVKETA